MTPNVRNQNISDAPRGFAPTRSVARCRSDAAAASRGARARTRARGKTAARSPARLAPARRFAAGTARRGSADRDARRRADGGRARDRREAAMGCAASTTGARERGAAGGDRAATSAPSAVRIDERWDASYVALRKIGAGKQGTVFEVEARDGRGRDAR